MTRRDAGNWVDRGQPVEPELNRVLAIYLQKDPVADGPALGTYVSAIKGMRILDRQTISPEEMQINVYIDGVDRLEKVSMKKIGDDWKFGGFIREPKQ